MRAGWSIRVYQAEHCWRMELCYLGHQCGGAAQPTEFKAREAGVALLRDRRWVQRMERATAGMRRVS